MAIRSPEPPPWCHPVDVNVKSDVITPSRLYVWLTVLVDPLARHSNLNLTLNVHRTSPMKSRPPDSSEPIF